MYSGVLVLLALKAHGYYLAWQLTLLMAMCVACVTSLSWLLANNALKVRNASDDFIPVDLSVFEAAYKT
jgi:hypothetical protein